MSYYLLQLQLGLHCARYNSLGFYTASILQIFPITHFIKVEIANRPVMGKSQINKQYHNNLYQIIDFCVKRILTAPINGKKERE